MENGWVKHLINDQKIVGTDVDVRKGLASWRKSQNTALKAVELFWEPRSLVINGVGDFWQSDDIATTMGGSFEVIRRRVQRCIEPYDSIATISIENKHINISFVSLGSQEPEGQHRVIQLRAVDVGKWFTIELTNEYKVWYKSYITQDRR